MTTEKEIVISLIGLTIPSQINPKSVTLSIQLPQ